MQDDENFVINHDLRKKERKNSLFTFILFGEHGSVGDTLISQQSSGNGKKIALYVKDF